MGAKCNPVWPGVTHNGYRYPASRRLWGVPIVVSVSEAPGVAHVLGRDSVVVDVDNHGVGVQWSETSNSDDWSKTSGEPPMAS